MDFGKTRLFLLEFLKMYPTVKKQENIVFRAAGILMTGQFLPVGDELDKSSLFANPIDANNLGSGFPQDYLKFDFQTGNAIGRFKDEAQAIAVVKDYVETSEIKTSVLAPVIKHVSLIYPSRLELPFLILPKETDFEPVSIIYSEK